MCLDGYYIVSGTGTATCTACSANCKTCTASGASVANTGYFVAADKTCSSCGTGVDTCTSATAPTKCSTGYSSVTANSVTSCV